MIDVVFNHTAFDAVLLQEHPEWYHYQGGKNVNRTGEWEDIIDLDFTKKDLWSELIDILKFYAMLGVDGYRCDVAPLIPLLFWSEARCAIKEINPDFIWLAESVHPKFIKTNRDLGLTALSDGELYQVFDILYDYDTHDEFMNYLTHTKGLKGYLEAIKRQEVMYPVNYCKLRNLENHDQPRIASLVTREEQLKQWTAFIFFVKGATMIYAGEEAMNKNRPSLFAKEIVDWSNNNLTPLITVLVNMKKDPIMSCGIFNVVDVSQDDIVVMTYENNEKKRYGIFNLGLVDTFLTIDIRDGEYLNFVNGNRVYVKHNKIILGENPFIFDVYK